MSGDMTIRSDHDGLYVEQADDQIRIASDLLDGRAPLAEGVTFSQDTRLLTVEAKNGTYRYMVHDYDEIKPFYEATRLRETQ